MADYNSKYSGEQIEQLLEQAGGGSAVTEQTVSGWGFTKNQGTITGVSANGTSVATSGVANIPAASTSRYGVTQLSSATNSTSTTLAATASAVKSAYDLANGKQDKLVSGTNVKTINGMSILGEGDIAVGADNSGKLEAVNVTPVISGSTVTYTVPAGVLAFCNPPSDATSVVLNLDCSSFSDGEVYQFHIFVNDTSSASLSIGWQGATSSTIHWANGAAPMLIGSRTTLELSLLGFVNSIDTKSYFAAYGTGNNLFPVL